MISKLFSSVLCTVVSPLLVAQQISHAEEPAPRTSPAEPLYAYRSSINLLAELGFDRAQANQFGSQYGLTVIPFEAPLKLAPADPAALADATVGTTLTFWILEDVTVRGGVFNRSSVYADAYGGQSIEAKVIRVRPDKARHRKGRNDPHVKEVLVGNYIKLELESSPRKHARSNAIAKNLAVWSVKGPYMVTVVPIEYALLIVACSIGCDLY
ncbi:MAG: hypothetical protein ABSE36_00020 [Terracidiphilus sp.]|jgi:hypothetical protein